MGEKDHNRIYITDAYCISPQRTFDQAFFENQPVVHKGNRYFAQEPAYGGLIPAGLLRRMGKAVRMGVGAGLPLINRNPGLEGIVLGTANGGLEDCLKFLNQIVDYEEGTLTPTNFVQSTPNAVAGSLALMSKNTGYNTTHVNKGLAFEGALLDVMLNLQEGHLTKMLLGSVEEISDYNYNIDFLAGSFKSEEVTSETLLSSGSPGTVCGEGAAMFVLETGLSANVMAELVDVDQISYPDQAEIEEKLNLILSRNGLVRSDIDTLVMGYSGDNRSDHWFDSVRDWFAESAVFTYKNLVGDYPTSSSFGMWMGLQILMRNKMPSSSKTSEIREAKNLLVYNHFKGVQHGFILLRSVSN